MKKIIFIVIMFLFFIGNIYAKEDLVINNVVISNGEITPNFDKYNNYYSITIDESIKSLDISCEYDEEKYDIEIGNNTNLIDNKLVYITIFDRDTLEQNTYIFKVYVNDNKSVVNTLDDSEFLDVESKKDSYNYAPLIGTICFVLIIVVFKIMFM